MKIGKKLFFGFGLSALLVIVLGIIAVYSLYSANTKAKTDLEFVFVPAQILTSVSRNYSDMRVSYAYVVDEATDQTLAANKAFFETALVGINSDVAQYIEFIKPTVKESEPEMRNLRLLESILADKAEQYFNKLNDFAHNNDKAGLESFLNGDVKPLSQEIFDLIEANIKINTVYKDNVVVKARESATTSTIILITVVIAILACMIIAAVYVTVSITKPVKKLIKAAEDITKGKLDGLIATNDRDEIGELSRSFGVVVDTFNAIIFDINKLSNEHSNGEIEYAIDVDKYSGSYKSMVESVNSAVGSYVQDTLVILDVFQAIAVGDFKKNIRTFPGKKVLANKVIGEVQANLGTVNASIKTLVKAAINGELDRRVDPSILQGNWSEMIVGLNNLLVAIAEPLNESQAVLERVSNGYLDTTVNGSYKGEFSHMGASINKTVTSIASYIKEISEVLSELAKDNFTVEIKREYAGDFINVKNSINAIITRLNTVINEINSASEQVSTGARLISDSSMSLSMGASDQASSVEELNATIEEILEQSKRNSQSVLEANTLVTQSKIGAETGNTQMDNMLTAMNEINDASNNISKIIKVIEDIAFQTNLLALNAAVEAARAGQHGRSFAVVAEQVRDLATRSQNAVKDTSVLIETTIDKVKSGSSMAKETAESLNVIVERITEVATIINNIETSSTRQTHAITQINEGIGQISNVTQTNSSVSEESASTAQELSSQAEVLLEMVNRFKLK